MSSLIIATIITLFQSILTCPSCLPLELRSSIFPPASGVPGGGAGAEAPSIYIGGGLPIKPPVLLIILPNPSPRWTRPLFRAPIWFPKACGSGYLSGPIFLPWLATLRTVLLGMLRILFSQFTWAEWCGKHVNPVHIFGLGCDIRPNQRVGPGYSQIFGRHCVQHILLPCTCTTVHMVLDTGLSHTSATIFYLSINSFVFCVHN